LIQTCGLIELEACESQFADSIDDGDSTLRGLFARLVGDSTTNGDAAVDQTAHQATFLSANLNGLAEDLKAITREVLSEIFLSRGCR
jgi:hypothetical protein